MPDLDRLVADDAVERRADFGEGEIALRALDRRHQFAARMLGFDLLALQHVEIGGVPGKLRLRRSERGLGAGGGGGGALLVGVRLLQPLLRAEAGQRKLLRAVELQRGALLVGVGAVGAGACGADLRLRLRDHGALRLDLPADAADGGVLRRDLVLGRVDGELVVAGVDDGEEVARAHLLVVCDFHLGDVTGDLGRHDYGVGADIGVVGRDEEAAFDKVTVAPIDAISACGDEKQRQQQTPGRTLGLGGRVDGRVGGAGEGGSGGDVLGHGGGLGPTERFGQ